MQEIEFVYDFASPNSYVALAKLNDLKRKSGLKVKFTPILLGGIFKLTSDAPVARDTLEYNYMVRNLERLSKSLKIEFKFPHARFPINSLKALRGSYFAREFGKEEDYIERVFRACWSKDEDISEANVLKNIIEDGLQLNFDRFTEFIENSETKKKLRDDTGNAYERGVFGAPTFFLEGEGGRGEEMYWGTPEILWYIESKISPSSTV